MGHTRLQVVVIVLKKWLMEYRYKQKINLFQINNYKFRRTWIIKHVWTRVHWSKYINHVIKLNQLYVWKVKVFFLFLGTKQNS